MNDPAADISFRIRGLLDSLQEAANAPMEDLGPPHAGESLSDLHQRLLGTRAAMSRVSELVGSLTLLQGRLRASLVDRRGLLEDAEADTVTTQRRPVLTEDFSSAKEKNARLGAATLEQRRAVRAAERAAADLDAALSYARDRHRELDRAVRDVDLRVRIQSLDPNIS